MKIVKAQIKRKLVTTIENYCTSLRTVHNGRLLRNHSNRRFTRFTRTDAHDLLDSGDENLAVADLACAGSSDDGIDRTFNGVVGDDDLDLNLGQEVDDVFSTTIHFGMPFLAAKALYFGDG